MGFTTVGTAKSICVLLQNLSFLPGVRQATGSCSLSPFTPPSRKRRVPETVSLYSSQNPASSPTASASILSPTEDSFSAMTTTGR
jgi:hypothetical protein